MWGIIAKHDVWRADREAEGARLLSEYRTKSYLGFESPALRQTIQTQPKQFGWVFLFFAGKSIKTQSILKSLKFSLDAVPHQWHFNYCNAALPQLDRGSDYESERHRFESYTPHQLNLKPPATGAFLLRRHRMDSNLGRGAGVKKTRSVFSPRASPPAGGRSRCGSAKRMRGILYAAPIELEASGNGGFSFALA